MRALIVLLIAIALPACANAPGRSLFPEKRPGESTGVLATPGAAVRNSLLPAGRPGNIGSMIKDAVRTAPASVASSSGYGAICGDPSIRGQVIAPIPGRIAGCGVPKAVEVREVSGVRLTTGAKVNCTTATALNKWVRDSVRPAVGSRGGGIASLKVVAHYSCRTRNNQPGAKISEHGRGNAIDIAAINLKDGSSLDVLKGWRDSSQGKVLRKVHAGACGPFGTVLGPDADRYHQDHFHFDVARHRGGSYCR